MGGFYTTRGQRRQMAAEYARQPKVLRDIPRQEWPACSTNQLRVLRSRDFLVQEFPATSPAVVRLSVSRTTLKDGEWVDGITWEELQRIKRECGYGDADAIEIYPGDLDVVNVANMRHLWIMAAPVECAWRKKTNRNQVAEAGG